MSGQKARRAAGIFTSAALSIALNPIVGFWRAAALAILGSTLVRLYLEHRHEQTRLGVNPRDEQQ